MFQSKKTHRVHGKSQTIRFGTFLIEKWKAEKNNLQEMPNLPPKQTESKRLIKVSCSRSFRFVSQFKIGKIVFENFYHCFAQNF